MPNSKILVVDDEPAIRNFLVRLLEREGYDVHGAGDGREALACLDASPFDVLLTDIKMAGLDGVGLLEEAKRRYPDLAVILLTGHATVASAIAALRQGAQNYLLKPAKNDDILTAIAAGLEARERELRRDKLEHVASQILEALEPAVVDSPRSSAVSEITYAGLMLNPTTYRAMLHAKPLDLTPTEFRLLLHLGRMPGVPFDYGTLVQVACGYVCTRQEAQEIIGTHVRNLRQKLGVEADQPLYIESIRGVGYRLVPVPTNHHVDTTRVID